MPISIDEKKMISFVSNSEIKENWTSEKKTLLGDMFRSLRAPIPVAAAPVRPARQCFVVSAARARRGATLIHETRRRKISSSSSPSKLPLLVCRANDDDNPSATSSSSSPSSSSVDLFGSLVALALWAALLFYALNFSPNQTPARDLYLLQKLIPGAPGTVDDGVAVNAVFYALFNAMGVMPALYAAVLIPAGRSGGGGGVAGSGRSGGSFPPRLPAWPFVAGSFALGFFALGPYLALWTPAPPVASEEDRGGPRDAAAPPLPQALEKSGTLGGVFLRALESPITAAVLFVAAASQALIAATAGESAWTEYLRLFDESRFVHVTSLDFCALSAFLPFWVSNDAAARKFGGSGSGGSSGGGSGNGATLAAAMAAVPLVGPALYLVLRPKAQWTGEKEKEVR